MVQECYQTCGSTATDTHDSPEVVAAQSQLGQVHKIQQGSRELACHLVGIYIQLLQ